MTLREYLLKCFPDRAVPSLGRLNIKKKMGGKLTDWHYAVVFNHEPNVATMLRVNYRLVFPDHPAARRIRILDAYRLPASHSQWMYVAKGEKDFAPFGDLIKLAIEKFDEQD